MELVLTSIIGIVASCFVFQIVYNSLEKISDRRDYRRRLENIGQRQQPIEFVHIHEQQWTTEDIVYDIGDTVFCVFNKFKLKGHIESFTITPTTGEIVYHVKDGFGNKISMSNLESKLNHCQNILIEKI